MPINQTSKKHLISWSLVFLFPIIVDQFVKSKIQNPFLNYNFAFSLPLPKGLIFFTYAIILIFICAYFFKNFRKFRSLEFFGWILIFSGAVSNIGERIVLGYVRDYIYILNGIFNLADGYIILGILVLLIGSKKISN
jgi:lipoprotein signal peptidase